jgi:signal transduction histidine kinase
MGRNKSNGQPAGVFTFESGKIHTSGCVVEPGDPLSVMNPAIPRRNEVPGIAAAVILVFAIANVFGWIYAIDRLKDPFHTNVMAPNTSLCLIVSAIALWAGSRESAKPTWRFVQVMAGLFVTLAAAATLFEYVSGMDIGIDRIFLRSTLYQWTAPNVLIGRIAPNTALALCLTGASFLWPNRHIRRFRLVECLAVPIFLIAFLSLMGYAFGVEHFYGIASYSAMAMQTAICLVAVTLGLLWMDSETGMMSMILGEGAGGVAARRLLLALLIIFPALGWIGVRAQDTFLVDLRFGTALLVIVSVVIFGFMIVRTALALDGLDAKRAAAETALVEANTLLESVVEQRTTALRRLSARLMHLQDDERRKIARELHDGLGQYLAALSINLHQLSQGHGRSEALLVDTRDILDRAIAETRTLSHLLHPPLLDEVGFHSAAKWYVEGFAGRSGMKINLKLPDQMLRLPGAVEIALFRVLQEALTNIHRHSGSAEADIILTVAEGQLDLLVRDYGKGIVLDNEKNRLDPEPASHAAGVGLTGMSERISELNGRLEISNTGHGTLIQITVPLPRVPAEEQALSA